jgi:hypothetical protein
MMEANEAADGFVITDAQAPRPCSECGGAGVLVPGCADAEVATGVYSYLTGAIMSARSQEDYVALNLLLDAQIAYCRACTKHVAENLSDEDVSSFCERLGLQPPAIPPSTPCAGALSPEELAALITDEVKDA